MDAHESMTAPDAAEAEGSEDAASTEAEGSHPVTARALAVGVALTVAAAVWVAQVELILHTAEISESVPLIASLAGLILLVLLNRALEGLRVLAERGRLRAGALIVGFGVITYLLHYPTGGGLRAFLVVAGVAIGLYGLGVMCSARWARMLSDWQLTRREIVLVYCFLSLSALMMSAKTSGYLLPTMSVYNYFGFGDEHLQAAGQQAPPWLALRDHDVVRTLYEGSDLSRPAVASAAGVLAPVVNATEGLWWPLMQVPWGAWLVPLACWAGVIFLVFLTGFCALGLLKGYWAEKERLRFPLIMIPLEISTGATRKQTSTFLSDWGFWVGFVVSGLFTFYVVMHALSPSLPAFRAYYSLAGLFREHPWDAVENAAIHIRPEIIGLSYFMETSITFSVWVSAIFTDGLAVGTKILGYETRHFPQPAHQGVGAFVILGLVLVWSARGWLADRLREVREGGPGAWPTALLWAGLIGGIGALVGIMAAAGMKLWAALYMFGTLVAFFLLYGRVRAETGVPHPSAYPRNRQIEVLRYIGGPRMWAGGATPALMGMLWFLGGGYTSTGAGAQIENLKIADEEDVRQSSMAWLTLAAPIIGLAIALIMRLAISYHYGLNFVEGGVVEGGYPVSQVRKFGGSLVEDAVRGAGPSATSGYCALYGAAVTLALVLLRRVFLRFPIHPLGFGLSMIRLRSFWAPFLFTWTIKTLLLKIGGARAYRRAAPAFLGFAIGHYFFAGIGLGCLAAAFPWLLEKITVINFD